MNRGDAYKLLSTRLEALRGEGYAALARRADHPGVTETVRIGDEQVEVEMVVRWQDRVHGTLRVSATALGPSTWMTQRLEESLVIGPGQ